MKRTSRGGAELLVAALALGGLAALAGCGGTTTGPGTTPTATSEPPAESPSAAATPSGSPTSAGPTFAIGGPSPSSTADEVTQALTTAFRYDLDMTSGQATCVATRVAGALTAEQKAATVSAWRTVAGGPPQPVKAPAAVLSKARAAAAACPVAAASPGEVRHTPAR